jgi:hypothetical protein
MARHLVHRLALQVRRVEHRKRHDFFVPVMIRLAAGELGSRHPLPDPEATSTHTNEHHRYHICKLGHKAFVDHSSKNVTLTHLCSGLIGSSAYHGPPHLLLFLVVVQLALFWRQTI